MTTFLDKLTTYVFLKKSTLEQTIIVLPNKRARVFLLDKIKQQLPHYTFAPTILSIEEFVQDLAKIRSLDPIDLLIEFYQVYQENTPEAETQDFEQFSNWAKIILQDFNEIDRYLIDPNHVFSYLKEVEVIKRWNLEPKDKTKLVDRQIAFWEKMPMYYNAFYQHLLNKGLGYQGLLYREAVRNLEFFVTQLTTETFLFAGFNALNQAEEKIIQHLLAVDKAEVLWDIDEFFINNPQHDAGLFVRRFKKNWAFYKKHSFEWIVNEFSKEKNIQIIGTSKAIGQSKIVSNIIKNILDEGSVSLDKVALVLGDEHLLIPTLHSLPNEVSSLNITMGYSAKNNPIQILIHKLFKAHINALQRNGQSYVFYYKDILDILSNPIIENYVPCANLMQVIKTNNLTFITHQRLMSLQVEKSALFELLFYPWNDSPLEIANRLQQIILAIKQFLVHSINEDRVTQTFLYAIYKIINKLISYCSNSTFVHSPKGLFAIYKQIIDLAEVSFEGEPLAGLQIMGVLESRVLDFDTVIITSMNEGKFPAGKATNTFVPYDIKRELGLPTFKEKDAIYTYHFYHLLLRAKQVYLIYNTEGDGLDGGEKSRFITQLLVEKQDKHTVVERLLQPEIPTIAYQNMAIPKTNMVLNRLEAIATHKGFSPSALTAYIRNPIQFYFQRILSIRETQEVEENIALNTLGTIIHQSLEELYKPFLNTFLSLQSVDSMIAQADKEVYRQFKEVYKEGEVTRGKNLLAFEVAKRNVYNFLKQEQELIKLGDAVKVLQLETTLDYCITHEQLPYPVIISGNVDRIEIRNNVVRIIDYKTGKVQPNELKITTWNGLTRDIKHEKIIQLLCYALMYERQLAEHPLEVGIISFKNMRAGFMPFGFKEGSVVSNYITSDILDSFKMQLIELIAEILDSSKCFEEIQA